MATIISGSVSQPLTLSASTSFQQKKPEGKRLLNKRLLLAYYASPIIVVSSQALGLFISLADIQFRFYNYLENTDINKSQIVINNIVGACSTVCSSLKESESNNPPSKSVVFEEKSGSSIFNSFILNTLIVGTFVLTFSFSFLLHIIVRTYIIQHYKEALENEDKNNISLRPVLSVTLVFLSLLFILNIVLTSLLISIEGMERIKAGIFACISIGFLLLIFIAAVSFAM